MEPNHLGNLLQELSGLVTSKSELLRKRALARDPAMVREINREVLEIDEALSRSHAAYQSLKVRDEMMVSSFRQSPRSL